MMRTAAVLGLLLVLQGGPAAAGGTPPDPAVPAPGDAPAAAAGLLSCERFMALVDLRASPELARVLDWLEQTLALLGADGPDGRIDVPVSELEQNLAAYCLRHPRGNVLDGLLEFLDPARQSPPEGVISAQAGVTMPRGGPTAPRPGSSGG